MLNKGTIVKGYLTIELPTEKVTKGFPSIARILPYVARYSGSIITVSWHKISIEKHMGIITGYAEEVALIKKILAVNL